MAKKSKVRIRKSWLDTKEKKIGAGIVGGVLIMIAIFLIVRESSYGKLTITNKTDLDIEYIKTSFVNGEGLVSDLQINKNVTAGSKSTTDVDPIYLDYTESNLEVAFKIAGHDEMFTDVGYFNEKFFGNINITFDKTDDPNVITIKIKAGNGIFQTTSLYCDEKYEIDLNNDMILD